MENSTPAVFTEDQLAECEMSNVLFPDYSASYSIGIETISNEEQTITCERSASFHSDVSTIHVENNETVFTEE